MTRRHVAEISANALAAGEVGVVIVAGGSGTRLGFEGPKGTYGIGSVSGASLFQIHAEKIVAMGRRHGKPLPLYIMTSPENHAATARFFEDARQLRPRTRPILRARTIARRRSSRRQDPPPPRRGISP